MIPICVLRLNIHCWSVFTVVDKLHWCSVQLKDKIYFWTYSNIIGLSPNSIEEAFPSSDSWQVVSNKKIISQELANSIHFASCILQFCSFLLKTTGISSVSSYLSYIHYLYALPCLWSPCCAPTAHGNRVFKGKMLLQNKQVWVQKPLTNACDLQDFPRGFRTWVDLGSLPIQPVAQTPRP